MAATLFALVGGCATVPEVLGGEPFDLPAGMSESIRIDTVRVEPTPAVAWIYASMHDTSGEDRPSNEELKNDFSGDVGIEVWNELRHCATGERTLNATILVDHLSMDESLRSLWRGDGVNEISALIEFVEPELKDKAEAEAAVPGTVVARYRVTVGARSGNLLERMFRGLVGSAGEELGRELCLQAFGRNPRPHWLQNSTK